MPIKQRTIDFVQDTRLLVARARELERRGAAAEALVAYDISPDMLAVAKARLDGLAIDWQSIDFNRLPFEDGSIDLVVPGPSGG